MSSTLEHPVAKQAGARIFGTLHLNKPPAGSPARIDLTNTAKAESTALPHERDEQVGMTGGIPSAVVEQGARDLKRGIQDTSKSVETDEAYAKLKRS